MSSSEAKGSAFEVFRESLSLGLRSFGGPVAHIAYFRKHYVEKLGWLDEKSFAELLALCQFLPGPSSSQFSFAVGLRRASWLGGLMAWLGFTLPSALFMIGFGLGLRAWFDGGHQGCLHGLKAATVGIVSHALWKMGRALCPDFRHALLGLVAASLVLCLPWILTQPLVIAGASTAALLLFRNSASSSISDTSFDLLTKRSALVLLVSVVAAAFALPLLANCLGSDWLRMEAAVYRAGTMVFGGGHVVLPLLETGVVTPGFVDRDAFLSGYAAAQALPGPLFSFAAYLGAIASCGPGGIPGALLSLVVLFLPGLLLVPAVLPFWQSLRNSSLASRAVQGANSAVVGILLAALIDPVIPAGVHSWQSGGIALATLLALLSERIPVAVLILGASLAGALLL